MSKPFDKRGARGRWISGDAFRVSTRRHNGKSYTVVEVKRSTKKKNPRSRIRVGPIKKRKVARRVGKALKGFLAKRNGGGRSRRR